ncbi:MAG: hypothetical protein JOZ07_08065 [Solirubrobacterales bacterium]|nr:hypothetical protein [Solirubrobacterales bacterium]
MSRAALRTIAFGDAEGQLWGAAVGAEACVAAFGGTATGAAAATGALRLMTENHVWRLWGDGVQLDVVPREPPGDGAAGGLELCDVRGTLTVSGEQRSIDCPGARCQVTDPPADGPLSARGVAGFFDDEAVSLLALRSGVAHHDADRVSARLFDADAWLTVDDPRLSTTYADDGTPQRASLELWVNDGEHEFPRRAAGEADGPAVTAHADGVRLSVIPLRCHSRGHEGAGVYLLATF